MKKDVHPDYHEVAFRDRSADFLLLTRSTATSDETVEVGGRTYPVVDVDVSSASHPFWTGRGRVLDTEGRVEKFRRRYADALARGEVARTPGRGAGESGR